MNLVGQYSLLAGKPQVKRGAAWTDWSLYHAEELVLALQWSVRTVGWCTLSFLCTSCVQISSGVTSSRCKSCRLSPTSLRKNVYFQRETWNKNTLDALALTLEKSEPLMAGVIADALEVHVERLVSLESISALNSTKGS